MTPKRRLTLVEMTHNQRLALVFVGVVSTLIILHIAMPSPVTTISVNNSNGAVATTKRNDKAPHHFLNCTPMLPDLPAPDVPHSTEALNDLPKMRAMIQKQQPRIEVYYEKQDKLEAFIRDKYNRKPSVLQLGGNNGWYADPLYPVVVAHEWSAIIVEALPHLFKSLVSNYAKKNCGCLWSELQLINAAVTDDGKRQVTMSYRITESWERGGGSVLRHHGEAGWQTMTVQGDNLAGILSQVAYPEIDLIQIDIEGLDEALLKQVDLIMGSIHPRMVCVETCDNYCSGFFSKHNFEVFEAPGQNCGIRDF